MPFEWIVALRFLREGRLQTALIVSGVGIGVGVIVFLSALITGLQASLIDKTLGTQAHIVVRPPDEEPRSLMTTDDDETVVRHVIRPAQRPRSIVGWQQAQATIERLADVTASAPTVAGSAFAQRGAASRSVAVRGIDPTSYLAIVDLTRYVVAGRFRLSGAECVVGTELAGDLGADVGDRLRLTAAEGRGGPFTVRAIVDFGNKDLNQRWVFVPLRAAQTMFDLQGGVSTIEVTVRELFGAETVAQRVAERTGLQADSWMALNSQLLVGLRSQGASSVMIQIFVVVAVAFGIASVLAVSVVQKSREIGILRATGTTSAQVVRIFLLQGAIVGLVGSLAGVVLGTGLALFFASLARNPDGSATFPVALTMSLYLRSAAVATATGLLSAALPARRASRLDPVDVIRYG